MMRSFLAALAILFCAAYPAAAQNQSPMGVSEECWNGTAYKPCSGANAAMVAGSVLTRASDTTPYTATATAPQTVCAAKSVTACVPGTILFNRQIINRFTLLKSGTTLTNANFIVWLFSAPPTLTTPTQFDATSFTGSRAADFPNYVGNAACATPVATSDTTAQVWYECTLSNPNTAGALSGQSGFPFGTVYYLITVTAAYTPVSAETFTPFVSGFN